LLVRERLVHLHDGLAQRIGTERRIDDAVELGQYEIAAVLEDMAREAGDHRLNNLAEERRETGVPFCLATREKPAVAGYQDRCKSAPGAPCRSLGHSGRLPGHAGGKITHSCRPAGVNCIAARDSL
jgi:hypothetical protein